MLRLQSKSYDIEEVRSDLMDADFECSKILKSDLLSFEVYTDDIQSVLLACGYDLLLKYNETENMNMLVFSICDGTENE